MEKTTDQNTLDVAHRQMRILKDQNEIMRSMLNELLKRVRKIDMEVRIMEQMLDEDYFIQD